MELENLRQQKPEGSDPFGGNRWFRIAIIVLGALSVVGVLVFLLIFLGFCAPNRQAANATPQPSPTAVVISEPQASPTAIAQQPTAAPVQPTAVMPTATLVISPPTTAPTKAAASQATDAPATAATAIPITVAPTAQPTIARATAANRVPTLAAKIKQGPFAGLSVIKLRYAPDNPVRNDPVYFYATISNRTGKDQNYRMCAEIYLPGKEKPLGTTDCTMTTIVPGVSEVPVGFWIGTGIKQCIPLRARLIGNPEDGQDRVPVTTAQDDSLWADFTVCP